MDYALLTQNQGERFSGIGLRNAWFRDEIQAAVNQVLEDARLIDGPALFGFEQDFADYVGSTSCVGVGNGLDALRLGLQGLGIGPGDEVLVPAQTFVASAIAVEQCGARPVFVDVDSQSGLVAVESVAEAIGRRTRAIMAVHLHGRVVDVAQLREVVGDSDIAIVEDAAQAHGATFGDSVSRTGSLGDFAAFSFYPTKNLGAVGDGGAVTTSRPELADSVRRLSRYGDREERRQGGGPLPGNSRLDTLQAAILSVFLPQLEEWNARRIAIAQSYDAVLAAHGITPDGDAHRGNVYHHYVLMHENRDDIAERLRASGVPTHVHYGIPAYRHPALGSYEGKLLPGAERRAAWALSLPIHPWMDEDSIGIVCEALDRSL